MESRKIKKTVYKTSPDPNNQFKILLLIKSQSLKFTKASSSFLQTNAVFSPDLTWV
jgi:hypothetical protein